MIKDKDIKEIDIEETIKALEVIASVVEWEYPLDYSIAAEDAATLLRAIQEEKTPVLVGRINNKQKPPFMVGICPSCGKEIESTYRTSKGECITHFCPFCAKAITFEEKKN